MKLTAAPPENNSLATLSNFNDIYKSLSEKMAPHSLKRRKLSNDWKESDYLDVENDVEERYPNSKSLKGSLKGSQRTSTPAKETEDFAYSGDSYKSNMFKLQTDEMLIELQMHNSARLEPIDDALRKLKAAIEDITETGPFSIHEASKLMQESHNITIPFPMHNLDKAAVYKLSYAPPADINVVGSYALKTMTKDGRRTSVDLIVIMPSSILQQKDYLNYRYFNKRAYYLACIAAGLQVSLGDMFNFKFGYFSDNDLQSMLVATPKSDKHESEELKWCINIVPAAPGGFFNESKLHPVQNSIRPKPLGFSQNSKLAPTPFYNATLSADSNFSLYLKLIHHTSKKVSSFRDACLLGRVWLRQRGFGSSISRGGFGNFEWTALMALLLHGGGLMGHSLLSASYSSYQLFKGLIQFLCSEELVANPIMFQASGDSFLSPGTPLFFDAPRNQNVLFKMTLSSYAALHGEAKNSLQMLNETTFDPFESTFILRKDNLLQEFDLLLQIPMPEREEEIRTQDHSTYASRLSLKVYETLNEGLTNRVNLVHVKGPEIPPWPLKSSASLITSNIFVGFIFNPGTVNRLVDHGPAAEAKVDAAKFQNFWGEKAELRRFKDGSILESVVWQQNTPSLLIKDIITYLLKRHMGKEISENVKFVGDGFSSLIPSGETSAKGFLRLMEGFRSFEQEVRNLDSLPLQLKQLSATGPQLRYSSIMPPISGVAQHLQHPADIVVQFEGSGRWPDDITAIHMTKIAFLLKVGSLLESSTNGLTSKIGIENSEKALLNRAFLDIIYPTGPVFRVRIHNEHENTLLERQIKDKSASTRSREDAVQAKSLYDRTYVQTPLHTQSVSNLCTRFPLLSPSMRLVKKWFESHMLSTHFTAEFIELLVIHTFLQPYPWLPPSCSATGFLRTLHFISRWDWRTTALVVDFSGAMTSKDIDAAHTRLKAWRKIDPAMNRTVLLAISNHDATGIVFTKGSPSRVVAARMTALARSACAMTKRAGLELNATTLFKPSMNDYDFIIHLSPEYSGSRRGFQDAKPMSYKNLEIQRINDSPLIGYEPATLFLMELQAVYSNTIVFFHDKVTNYVIAGLWNPQTFSRSFKINTPHATKPSGSETARSEFVVIDRLTILSEISRLGGNLVARIEQCK